MPPSSALFGSKDFASAPPFLLGWRESFSIDCHGSRQSLLKLPEMATRQGAQAGKVIKFSMQAPFAPFLEQTGVAQCVLQAWPLERFQEGRETYFIHQSSDFCFGTARGAAGDLL